MLRFLLTQSFVSGTVNMNSSFGARRSIRQICKKSTDQFDIDAVLSFFNVADLKSAPA